MKMGIMKEKKRKTSSRHFRQIQTNGWQKGGCWVLFTCDATCKN